MTALVQTDNRKACCRVELNLGPVARRPNGLTMRRCRVCQCRHFEAAADPGVTRFKGERV